MMETHIIGLYFVLFVISVVTECPIGWTLFQNTCFIVSSDEETWADAQNMCTVGGGMLAEPKTREAIDFVKSISKDAGGFGLFIGGNDNKYEDNWVWTSTGQKITLNDWYPGEPNNGGAENNSPENCLITYGYGAFAWADFLCHRQLKYICEKQPDSTKTVVNATEGDDITLVCQTGYPWTHPKLTLSWNRTVNGKVATLPTNTKGGILTFPDLIIKSAMPFDNGTYTCTVSAGTLTKSNVVLLFIEPVTEMCKCPCDNKDKTTYLTFQASNKTYDTLREELKPKLQVLQKTLQVNKTLLSSYIRRRTSAPDSRRSSKGIGYVATALIVLGVGFFIFPDIVAFIKKLLSFFH